MEKIIDKTETYVSYQGNRILQGLDAIKHDQERAEWKRVINNQQNKDPYHGLYFRN